VQQTSDGGYIVAGWTGLTHDVYLVKTNASGDTLWTKRYGGGYGDEAHSVQLCSDGGYIVAGYTSLASDSYYDQKRDVYLLKTKSSGDTLWTRTYGGPGDDIGCSVQQTSDGGYIIAGSTSSFGDGSGDVYLVKTNSSGDTLWTRTFGGKYVDKACSVQQTSDGGYVVAGTTSSFSADSSSRVYLIKTGPDGRVVTSLHDGPGNLPTEYIFHQNYPNPFNPSTTIGYALPARSHVTLTVFNVLGQLVVTLVSGDIEAGYHEVQFNGSNLASGVYFYRMQAGGYLQTRKLLLMK